MCPDFINARANPASLTNWQNEKNPYLCIIIIYVYA